MLLQTPKPSDFSTAQVAAIKSLVSGAWRGGLPTVALFGDSHMRLQYDDYTFPGVRKFVSRQGFIYMANALLGVRFRVAGDYGVTGYKSDQILTKLRTDLPAVVAANPTLRAVFLDGGTNDLANIGSVNSFGQVISAATTITNLQAAVDFVRGLGLLCFMQTELPRAVPGGPATTVMTAPQIAFWQAVNAWKRDYLARTPGSVCVDVTGCVLNYSSVLNMSKGLPESAMMDSEGLHIASFEACYRLALKWAAAIDQVFPPAYQDYAWNTYDGTNGDPKQWWKTPGTDGAGVLGTGFTGTILSNMRIERHLGDSTTTGVASVVTRKQMCTDLGIAYDGVPGLVQKVALTATGSDGLVRIENSWASARLAAGAVGKRLLLSGEVGGKVTSAGANDSIQSIWCEANGQSTTEIMFETVTSKMTSCKNIRMRLELAQPWLVTAGESGFKINPFFGYQLLAGATADIYLSGPSFYEV